MEIDRFYGPSPQERVNGSLLDLEESDGELEERIEVLEKKMEILVGWMGRLVRIMDGLREELENTR